ncbi:MAG: fibronectin type III domain-containing protein [Marmoricola sp.]
MRISRWLLGPALVLSLVSFPSAGDASPAPAKAGHRSSLTAAPLAKPTVALSAPQHGKAALRALGRKLSVAARQNGTSTKKLHDVLADDPTAWVDRSGQLFYADRFAAPKTSARLSTSATSVPPAPQPLGSTFALHSKPGSKHVVYLDFDGIYLNGGGWVYNGYKNGTYKGFSLDSSYGSFSDTERAYIQNAWQIISEKYAPFDIDVTTQAPSSSAYNRAGSGDATYGDHVVFTDVTTGSGAKPAKICPYGCDGIAYTDSFDDPTDNVNRHEPTWIYTADLKTVSGMAGEIAAHEVGHTLGLLHDGLGAGGGANGSGDDEYYGGTDLWSPVMGNGVAAMTQFSKGEYPGADNTEDDLAVIAAHGAPVRPDDEGSPASPVALGQQSTYSRDGIIEDAADKDVFTIFRTCTSSLTAHATSVGSGRSLDLQLRVLSSDGATVLGSDNPATTANTSTFPRTPRGGDAQVTVAAPPAGTIQVEVDGVGQSDPATDPDGYSDYGSVGSYHLTITGCSNGATSVGATPGQVQAFTATQPSKSTTLNLSWTAPLATGDGPVTGYRIYGAPSGAFDVAASDTSAVLTGLTPGTDYDLSITALNAYGEGSAYDLTKHMATWTPSTAPKLKGSAKSETVTLDWTEPTNPGRAVGTFWTVSVYYGSEKLQTWQTDYGYTGFRITGVHPGRFRFSAYLSYDADSGTHSPSASTYVEVGPSAPRIGTASSGATGGTVNLTARWSAPTTLRGCKISHYYVIAYQLSSTNRTIRSGASSARPSTARSYTWALPKGKFRFKVQASACGGYTDVSGYSNIVYSR